MITWDRIFFELDQIKSNVIYMALFILKSNTKYLTEAKWGNNDKTNTPHKYPERHRDIQTHTYTSSDPLHLLDRDMAGTAQIIGHHCLHEQRTHWVIFGRWTVLPSTNPRGHTLCVEHQYKLIQTKREMQCCLTCDVTSETRLQRPFHITKVYNISFMTIHIHCL